jgi:hypothetical protein
MPALLKTRIISLWTNSRFSRFYSQSLGQKAKRNKKAATTFFISFNFSLGYYQIYLKLNCLKALKSLSRLLKFKISGSCCFDEQFNSCNAYTYKYPGISTLHALRTKNCQSKQQDPYFDYGLFQRVYLSDYFFQQISFQQH